MNLFDTMFQQWPAILVGLIGALVPRGSSTKQRVGFGLMAAFTAAFVMWLWPAEGRAQAADAASNE